MILDSCHQRSLGTTVYCKPYTTPTNMTKPRTNPKTIPNTRSVPVKPVMRMNSVSKWFNKAPITKVPANNIVNAIIQRRDSVSTVPANSVARLPLNMRATIKATTQVTKESASLTKPRLRLISTDTARTASITQSIIAMNRLRIIQKEWNYNKALNRAKALFALLTRNPTLNKDILLTLLFLQLLL